MAVRPEKRLLVLRRRQQVASLYLQGWTQSAIAEELKVGQSTVCSDLQAVREQWRKSAVRDFDLAREEELSRLKLIEREAWAAWERSQKPTQEARVRDGITGQSLKTMKSRHGDVRCLAVVLKCVEARRDLLELNTNSPLVQIHSEQQVSMAQLSGIRRELLENPDYLDYLHERLEKSNGPINLPRGRLQG